MNGPRVIRWAAALAVVLGAAGTALAPPFVPRPAPRPVFRPAPHPEPMPGVRPGARPGFRPGGGIHPDFPHEAGILGRPPVASRPSPAQARAGVQELITTRPAAAFGALHGEWGQVLPPAERIQLARRAVNQLALRVEADRGGWKALAEVRAAERGAQFLDADLRQGLESLARLAGRRALAESLQSVCETAERGQWLDTRARAVSRLIHADLEGVQVRAEVREALKEIAAVGLRTPLLDRVQKGLADAVADRPPADPFAGLDLAPLPPELRTPVEGLRGLATLRVAAADGGQKPPQVSLIRGAVAAFERAGADATLGRQVLQDLAVKAFLDGHADEARTLLPADGPAEHAAQLLRDMKALALGTGTVHTWPAQQPNRGGDGTRGPPPGLRPLLPEGSGQGWRPPVREGAGAGLPPLEKAAELGKTLRSRAEAALEPERAALQKKGREALVPLHAALQHLRQQEDADRKRFGELEASLHRKLTPGERVHVLHLAGQNQTNAQIVAALQKQDQADDEEFLKDLANLLGRPLTADERTQALGLRKQGKKAAEVAAVLRKQPKQQPQAGARP